MIALRCQHYRNRARDFLDGMKFLQEDLDVFGYSSALLGIHGAISYADALRIGMDSKKLTSENHLDAAGDLESLLNSRRFEKQQGIKHLKMLLARKSMVSYAAQTVRKNELEDIVKRAIRFADWAEITGRRLGIEGW
jgi:hypothetical protein